MQGMHTRLYPVDNCLGCDAKAVPLEPQGRDHLSGILMVRLSCTRHGEIVPVLIAGAALWPTVP